MFSKGHLISKGLFAILNSSKKRMKQFDHSTVRPKKTNLFVRFLEESLACKKHYDFVWPLRRPLDKNCTFLKVGKSQKLFTIWSHPKKKGSKSMSLNIWTWCKKLRDSDLVHFFEDGNKIEIRKHLQKLFLHILP